MSGAFVLEGYVSYINLLEGLSNEGWINILLTISLVVMITSCVRGLFKVFDWETHRKNNETLSKTKTRNEYYRTLFSIQASMFGEEALWWAGAAAVTLYLIFKELIPYVEVLKLVQNTF